MEVKTFMTLDVRAANDFHKKNRKAARARKGEKRETRNDVTDATSGNARARQKLNSRSFHFPPTRKSLDGLPVIFTILYARAR